jgi:hypothetical protein
MNILDENLEDDQWQRLRSWRVPVRKIGKDIGRLSMTDEEIIPLLHDLGSVTFFTRDADYYERLLCHTSYCLVYLDIPAEDVARTTQRFLRHPKFRTWARRSGKVVRVSYAAIRVWQLHARQEERVEWST